MQSAVPATSKYSITEETNNSLSALTLANLKLISLHFYLLEISVKHNNYSRSYSLNIRTTCFGLNRPSSGPQDLKYALCNICVSWYKLS